MSPLLVLEFHRVTASSSPSSLRVDWSDCMVPEPDVVGGFSESMTDQFMELTSEEGRARATALALEVQAFAAAGRYGFFQLPTRTDLLDVCRDWCGKVPSAARCLLIGIGGSSATARVLTRLVPRGPERMHVVDTVDPAALEPVFSTWDPSTTHVIAVSKSGGTLETLSVFACVEAWMHASLGNDAASRMTMICGEEEDNPLRQHGIERGYHLLPIPKEVGGRFSALTPVGLAPALLLGLDAARLLSGAKAMQLTTASTTIEENPALLLALLHANAPRWSCRSTLLWPYGTALEPLGPWWAQLVGESLGKRDAEPDQSMMPTAAVGPGDQHSLLQLLMESPAKTLVTFVRVASGSGPLGANEDAGRPGMDIPAGASHLTSAAGSSLSALLHVASEATRFALRQAGRPSLTIELAAADEESIGAFFFLYEMVVTYWAHLWRVNAFDQPGVQLGKDAAKALLTGAPETLHARMHALIEQRKTQVWSSPQP